MGGTCIYIQKEKWKLEFMASGLGLRRFRLQASGLTKAFRL